MGQKCSNAEKENYNTVSIHQEKEKVSGQEPKFPSHEPRTRRASYSKEVIKMRAEINEGQKARQYRKSIHEDSFQQSNQKVRNRHEETFCQRENTGGK